MYHATSHEQIIEWARKLADCHFSTAELIALTRGTGAPGTTEYYEGDGARFLHSDLLGVVSARVQVLLDIIDAQAAELDATRELLALSPADRAAL